MSKFSEQVPRRNDQFTFLPAFHTCDGVDARKYLQSQAIDTEDVCEVFKERISYFFYGKPAYKYQLPDISSRQLSLYPVCFVFDVEKLIDIKRIYPFDSGANHHGLMSEFINSKIPLVDFELEPDTGRIRDVILKFHDTNENYLDGKLSEPSFDPFDHESIEFTDMISTAGQHKVDERRNAIEIQCGPRVSFGNGALKGVILPASYLESLLIAPFLEDPNCNVQAYSIDVWNPLLNFASIPQLARRIG